MERSSLLFREADSPSFSLEDKGQVQEGNPLSFPVEVTPLRAGLFSREEIPPKGFWDPASPRALIFFSLGALKETFPPLLLFWRDQKVGAKVWLFR